MSQRVIEDDGFDKFLPTACYPDRRELRVLEGVPDSVDLESVVLGWALEAREADEEVLVAFKVDEAHFKVVRRVPGGTDEGVYPARPQLERSLS